MTLPQTALTWEDARASAAARICHAYFSELQGRGVDAGPVADRDHGMRDFLVVDPWGNRLVSGELLGVTALLVAVIVAKGERPSGWRWGKR